MSFDHPRPPKRVQMTRRHQWRPDNPTAAVVDRSTRWGNPFRVSQVDGQWTVFDNNGVDYPAEINNRERATAKTVELFALDIEWGTADITIGDVRAGLAGYDVACWCPVPGNCHGDVLLSMLTGTWDHRLIPALGMGGTCQADQAPQLPATVCKARAQEHALWHFSHPGAGRMVLGTARLCRDCAGDFAAAHCLHHDDATADAMQVWRATDDDERPTDPCLGCVMEVAQAADTGYEAVCDLYIARYVADRPLFAAAGDCPVPEHAPAAVGTPSGDRRQLATT